MNKADYTSLDILVFMLLCKYIFAWQVKFLELCQDLY